MSSICEQVTGLGVRQFWRDLNSRINSRRIPFSGSLALTHRCNLRCIHCYAKEQPDEEALHAELNASQWFRIIDEIKVAGCLSLLLTGGEPLLREDFSEIYAYAKKNGFLVTVFTNATLVSTSILELFKNFPPRLVEVSLYGASAEIQDRITGVRGSFSKAMQGIKALVSTGIRVRLKSILMTLNCDEFAAIEALAKELGVEFRSDPALFPTLAGDRGPVDLRVSPEQAVEMELAGPGKVEEWLEFLSQFKDAPRGDGLYNCGAGLNTFHVDPLGWLYPCMMVRSVRHSLGTGSFDDGWQHAFNDFRKVIPAAGMPCQDCEKKLACGYCPGFFEMENGSELVPSEYLCQIGKHRFAKINAESRGG